jgi:tetratricopeptide (TPR) repeat protein
MQLAISGDPNSPVAKAVRLNQEGVMANRSKNYDLAKTKFEECLKLRPGEAAPQRNLGSVYESKASEAHLAGKNGEAAALLARAIELFESSKSVDWLKISLPQYASLLRSLGRESEASKAEARLSELRLRDTGKQLLSTVL